MCVKRNLLLLLTHFSSHLKVMLTPLVFACTWHYLTTCICVCMSMRYILKHFLYVQRFPSFCVAVANWCLLIPLMLRIYVSRKWMAATRWRALPVNSTSVGCVWASSAESTHTVTLTTHTHPVTTSELSVSGFTLFQVSVSARCTHMWSVFCLFQTLPRRGSRWRRCLLEWWGGLTPVQHPTGSALHLNALYPTWTPLTMPALAFAAPLHTIVKTLDTIGRVFFFVRV